MIDLPNWWYVLVIILIAQSIAMAAGFVVTATAMLTAAKAFAQWVAKQPNHYTVEDARQAVKEMEGRYGPQC